MSWPGQVIANIEVCREEGGDRQRDSTREREYQTRRPRLRMKASKTPHEGLNCTWPKLSFLLAYTDFYLSGQDIFVPQSK